MQFLMSRLRHVYKVRSSVVQSVAVFVVADHTERRMSNKPVHIDTSSPVSAADISYRINTSTEFPRHPKVFT